MLEVQTGLVYNDFVFSSSFSGLIQCLKFCNQNPILKIDYSVSDFVRFDQLKGGPLASNLLS